MVFLKRFSALVVLGAALLGASLSLSACLTSSHNNAASGTHSSTPAKNTAGGKSWG